MKSSRARCLPALASLHCECCQLQQHQSSHNNVVNILQYMQKASKVEVAASNLPEVSIVAHVASAKLDGPYALVALAMGVASGGPELDGVLLHWACVSGQDQDWQQPPPGWHTDPNYSQGAGMDLLQTGTRGLHMCIHGAC